MTMPNFLIIGAAKSGTSALYQILKTQDSSAQIWLSSARTRVRLEGSFEP